MRSMPRKNIGMLRNSRLKMVNALSRMPYCRRALTIPMGMPMSSSKKMPNMAIITVAGKRCRMAVRTGRYVM